MAGGHSSSPPKVERRVIEKNRRNHMKILYSKLYSLLPNHGSKEAVALPDQVDEAVKYIKSLQLKLERCTKKKETLLVRKRSQTRTSELIPDLKSPRIQIHEIGAALDVVLITGNDDKFIFYEIIRIIHEEGAEVVNANFSVLGNSIFHIVHAKTGEFEAARVSNRLKEFVNRSIRDEESQPEESWEFEIQPNIWES